MNIENVYVIYEGSIHEGGGIGEDAYINIDYAVKDAKKIVKENQIQHRHLYGNKPLVTLPYDWKQVDDYTWTNGLEEVKILKLNII